MGLLSAHSPDSYSHATKGVVMLPVVASIAAALIEKAGEIISKKVEDKDKANEIIAELQKEILVSQSRILEEKASIILAEARGESWLQRNWRPILMLTVVAIIANNYLIAPYVNAIFGKGTAPFLELPQKLWDLMTLGVGGYIVGRSGEKIAKILKQGG